MSKTIGKDPDPDRDNYTWDGKVKEEKNQTTLLWSIKREKWFRGPDLPEEISLLFQNDVNYYAEFKKMCVISVGLNTAFVLHKKHTFSFNFTKKIGQNHKSPPDLLFQESGYHFQSCAFHLQKDYHRYKYNYLVFNISVLSIKLE